MSLFNELRLNMTRRHFFSQGSNLLGTASLASLLGANGFANDASGAMPDSPATCPHIFQVE